MGFLNHIRQDKRGHYNLNKSQQNIFFFWAIGNNP